MTYDEQADLLQRIYNGLDDKMFELRRHPDFHKYWHSRCGSKEERDARVLYEKNIEPIYYDLVDKQRLLAMMMDIYYQRRFLAYRQN